MKGRRGTAVTGRSGQSRGSFKYHAVETSEDEVERNSSWSDQQGEGGEHPTFRTLEHHLRSFRKTSTNRLGLIVVGVIAVVMLLFWAIA